ncbi:Hypothetical protein D9617_23g006000 [Elsinoe fawcettii]|nr:Hypothetical protein D9617_23g006000 [Elsinoe fawcettii]
MARFSKAGLSLSLLFAGAALVNVVASVNFDNNTFGAFGPAPVAVINDVTTTDPNNPLFMSVQVGGAGSYATEDWPNWQNAVQCTLPETGPITGNPCVREAITQLTFSAAMEAIEYGGTNNSVAVMKWYRNQNRFSSSYVAEDRGQGPSCPVPICPLPYYDQGCPANPLTASDGKYILRKPGYSFDLKDRVIKVTCKKTCANFGGLNEANTEATLRLIAAQMRNNRGQVANIQLYRPGGARPYITKCRVTVLSDASSYNGGRNWLGSQTICPDLIWDNGFPGSCNQP